MNCIKFKTGNSIYSRGGVTSRYNPLLADHSKWQVCKFNVWSSDLPSDRVIHQRWIVSSSKRETQFTLGGVTSRYNPLLADHSKWRDCKFKVWLSDLPSDRVIHRRWIVSRSRRSTPKKKSLRRAIFMMRLKKVFNPMPNVWNLLQLNLHSQTERIVQHLAFRL